MSDRMLWSLTRTVGHDVRCVDAACAWGASCETRALDPNIQFSESKRPSHEGITPLPSIIAPGQKLVSEVQQPNLW